MPASSEADGLINETLLSKLQEVLDLIDILVDKDMKNKTNDHEIFFLRMKMTGIRGNKHWI